MAKKAQHEQENVLDGTIFVFQEAEGHGSAVTIAGRDDKPYIIDFDMEDLQMIVKSTMRVAGIDGPEKFEEFLGRNFGADKGNE